MNRRDALACLFGLPLAVTPRPPSSPPPLTRAMFDKAVRDAPRVDRENARRDLILCDLPPPILAASPRVLRVLGELAARRRREST